MDNNQSGQIGLVVLLIMTTMLTVGIGAISRSTQDLKITRQEVEASQIFNAAEAGVETALGDLNDGVTFTNGLYSNTLTVDGIDVDYTVAENKNINTEVQENQVLFIDTESSQDGDAVDIKWAQDDDCSVGTPASLVVKVYNTSTQDVLTQAYAKCDGRQDGFLSTGGSGSITIILTEFDDIVRVRPVYNSTRIQVTVGGGGGGTWTELPLQGFSITATAVQPENLETKVVVLEKSLDTAPSVFDYSLFSGTTILMN